MNIRLAFDACLKGLSSCAAIIQKVLGTMVTTRDAWAESGPPLPCIPCIVDNPPPPPHIPSIRTVASRALRPPSPRRSTPFEQLQRQQSVVFMSSTGQSASPTSNIQLIINALADYAKITGIDLSESPLVTTLEQLNSPDDILQLLHSRETAFKEYRQGNRRLIDCLSPAVRVLQAFSGILGGAVR